VTDSSYDVVVVGGGLIGLASAWRLVQRGLRVAVVDPAPAAAASHAAAGMLAPITEVHYGEDRLLRLNVAAAERYPAFVDELESEARTQVGYRRCGTLTVAADASDRAVLDDLASYLDGFDLRPQRLTSRECRMLEPMLATRVRGGLLTPHDHQVDNRRLAAALLTAVVGRGVTLVHDHVAALVTGSDRATGVRLGRGEALGAGTVLLAAGPWSGRLAPLTPEVAPPVRPVKGVVMRLHDPASPPTLSRNLRAVVAGGHVYLVPRADGEVVIGATVEEKGFDTTVQAGAVYELLRDAHDLVPGLAEWPLVETLAGLRPGSPDNAPIVGPAAMPGLVVASGHYRNGVLLTPITADAIAACVVDGVLPSEIADFTPERFGGPDPARASSAPARTSP
jgi:glycine oxidase